MYIHESLPKIIKFGRDFTELYQFNIKQSEMCSFGPACDPVSTVSVWIQTRHFIYRLSLGTVLQKKHYSCRLSLLCTLCLCCCKLLEWLKFLLHSEHLYGLSPVWTLMCLLRVPYSLNAFSHTVHLYGLSPVWTLIWMFCPPDVLNALSHMWHLYGLSLVWTLVCLLRDPESLNAFSHVVHLYGLSPVWTLIWMFCPPDVLNALSHMWHLYGLSPVWILMCLFRDPDSQNAFSHTWHLYGLSPVWTLMCIFRAALWQNTASHKWHLYDLSPMWTVMCMFRSFDLTNALLQNWHLLHSCCGCTNVCLFSSPASLNALSHMLLENGFSVEWLLLLCAASSQLLLQHLPHSVHLYLLAWTFMWLSRLLWCEKHFPHWLQEINCSPVCLFPRLVKLPSLEQLPVQAKIANKNRDITKYISKTLSRFSKQDLKLNSCQLFFSVKLRSYIFSYNRDRKHASDANSDKKWDSISW